MFTPQGLLKELAPCRDAPVWWLGLSGGLDSMALLEALTQLRQTHDLPPVQAIHVHHGLHPDADAWAAHCQQQCDARFIPLHILRVELEQGASIESAARAARYEVFESLIGSGDYLLLAHHRDDQLETLLFRLVRGTGLRGLSGMPRQRSLAAGRLLRPMLCWRRSELAAWAVEQNLLWIEDPANRDQRFARTALRHELLPLLRQQWPAMENSLLRLADHVSEASSLLDERAAEDLALVQAEDADEWLAPWPSLELESMLELSPARQSNLLRYWLTKHDCLLPDHRQLREVLQQLPAASDSQPVTLIGDYQLRRSSGRLWLLSRAGVSAGCEQALAAFVDTRLVNGNGELIFRPMPGGLMWRPGKWRIDYRQGGERIKLSGRPHRSLKQLFQEAAIPFWLRPALPLLYCDGRLVSVAGRWNSEDACAAPDQLGWQISWQPAAQDRPGDKGFGRSA
ncbi:MAG TPA: tRNA lysidine(34) synthetase TilS [Pseudomonas xinjiangensis]|uniref:tRNA(Ile)-lysidine synthase n=2 Tax=root TaxID=1 RepID=A0A7V1FRM5_9GAMM|nr:tRNA lysidine(34) synthetase TilS [Halopseudomonas xinjiangensis]HEC46603.1 tRNA lysidine(34) synthetase TilS [Halopseudomonas xinjiangensis]